MEIKRKEDAVVRIPLAIAAVSLILNSLIVLFKTIVNKNSMVAGLRSNPSIVLGIILGILILTNKRQVIIWTRVAIIIGAAIFMLIYFVQNNLIMAILQLFYLLSIAGLIFGRPGRTRIGICSVALVLYLLLLLTGIQSTFIGKHLLGKVVVTTMPLVREIKNGEVKSITGRYQLQVPSDEWKIKADKAAKQENPDADVWLVQPDYNAQTVLIKEAVTKSLVVNIDTFTDSVLSEAYSSKRDFEVIRKDTVLTASGIVGYSVIAKATSKLTNMYYQYGFFTVKNSTYQIVCFVEEDNFEYVKEDFRKIISSFQPE